jgi:hypothetical protein
LRTARGRSAGAGRFQLWQREGRSGRKIMSDLPIGSLPRSRERSHRSHHAIWQIAQAKVGRRSPASRAGRALRAPVARPLSRGESRHERVAGASDVVARDSNRDQAQWFAAAREWTVSTTVEDSGRLARPPMCASRVGASFATSSPKRRPTSSAKSSSESPQGKSAPHRKHARRARRTFAERQRVGRGRATEEWRGVGG